VATSVEGLREVRAAPITRVDRNGLGLARAVESALTNAPRPVPIASLDGWRTSSIGGSIEAVDSRVAEIASTGGR